MTKNNIPLQTFRCLEMQEVLIFLPHRGKLTVLLQLFLCPVIQTVYYQTSIWVEREGVNQNKIFNKKKKTERVNRRNLVNLAGGRAGGQAGGRACGQASGGGVRTGTRFASDTP